MSLVKLMNKHIYGAFIFPATTVTAPPNKLAQAMAALNIVLGTQSLILGRDIG
jgi:hypothetical protein